MKITRGQLRALVDRTQGFVDELELELTQGRAQEVVGDVTVKFHHIRITVSPKGRWWAVNQETEALIAEGQIEPITNES